MKRIIGILFLLDSFVSHLTEDPVTIRGNMNRAMVYCEIHEYIFFPGTSVKLEKIIDPVIRYFSNRELIINFQVKTN